MPSVSHCTCAVVLSLFVSPAMVRGDEPAPVRLTLEQARETALARSPGLRAKRAQLAQAEGRLDTATTFAFNPELSVEVGRRERPEDTVTDRSAWLDQEFEIGGQRSLRGTQAQAELDAVRFELLREEHLLAARVRGAFVGALRARDLVQVEQANVDLARSLAEASRKRFDAGATTQMEVNLATGQAGRAERSLLIAEGAYRAARSVLAEVVAMDPTNPPEPDGDLALPLTPIPPLPELLASASLNRPDLEAFRKFTEVAQARIDLAHRQRTPNLVAGAGYAREEGDDRILSARFVIGIPIFNRNRGAIAEAEGVLQQALAETEAGEVRVRQEVASAFHRYQAGARAASRFQEQVLSTLQENLHLLRRSFEAGKISWPEVLVFRREFVDIQRESIETLTDAQIAGIELDLAAGVPPPAPPPETGP